MRKCTGPSLYGAIASRKWLPPPRSPKPPLFVRMRSATRFHRAPSNSETEREERTSRMPHPQSETAKRRQSDCLVRTAVPVGNGDFPGHASGRNTTCSGSRSCGIHECSFPIGSAERFVIFTFAFLRVVDHFSDREPFRKSTTHRRYWLRADCGRSFSC